MLILAAVFFVLFVVSFVVFCVFCVRVRSPRCFLFTVLFFGWRAVAANGPGAAAGSASALEKALQQLANLAGLNMSSRIDVSPPSLSLSLPSY